MAGQLRICPKCNAPAEFRLGEWECPSCGYLLPREQPSAAVADNAEPRDDGINRAKLLLPPQPPAGPAFPSYQLRTVREPAENLPNLSGEKVTFLTIYFFVTIGAGFLTSLRVFGASVAIAHLPGIIGGALVVTLAMGFALYFDNDCFRQCSIWFLGLILFFSLIATILSFFSGMFAQVLPILPESILFGWLFTILWRDRRSEG